MLSFKQYIIENEVNSHMQHLEDAVWDSGVDGVRRAINYLQHLRDQLSGTTSKKVNITVKWDGAPSIFAGIDPSDDKFFVAKKGIFNKSPKIYKTDADIDADTKGDLNVKLKLALKHFPSLGIKGVIQGDFLYAKKDLREIEIDGVPHITFHPNTILYAIPKNSELAKKILSSELGVVWHTQYRGQSFETMSASFGKEIASSLKKTKTVWSIDAVYKDVSGMATMTEVETQQVTALLRDAGKLFNKINKRSFDVFANNEELNIRVNVFINSKIRSGQRIEDPKKFAVELKDSLHSYFTNEINKKKTDKGKASVQDKLNNLLSLIDSVPTSELEAKVNLYNKLIDAKLIIVSKLNKAATIGTFLLTQNGLKVTTPEGFVAINHMGKNAVKLIDRLEFSWANFSPDVIRGWQK